VFSFSSSPISEFPEQNAGELRLGCIFQVRTHAVTKAALHAKREMRCYLRSSNANFVKLAGSRRSDGRYRACCLILRFRRFQMDHKGNASHCRRFAL